MATTNQEIEETPNPHKRNLVLLGITVVFILAGVSYALYYAQVLSKREQTDNAYVGGNLVALSSQIQGNVREILADETQWVKAGTPLIKLDPTDADVALSQTEAKLGAVVRQQREHYADSAHYDATIDQRKLSLKNTEDDLARRLPLAADHTLSGEDIAHARQAVENAKASLKVAVKQADAIHSSIAGIDLRHHPNVLVAKADFIQAWLAVRRNTILAPVSGYIAKRSVQVGSHVTPGATLMSIVPLDQLWVDANFKESELKNIRIGQTATIEADMYGDKVVFHGQVFGLLAGTGSAFSLLPAQNATGNWIKVVQRLPVRIMLNPKELSQHPLRIGLSTTVTVDTHQTDGAMLGTTIPTRALYSTQALNQPLHEAASAADAIITRNMGQ